MHRALVIIADDNYSGINRTVILPAIRYKYLKSEYKATVVDLDRDDYNIMSGNASDPLTRSYMHYLKCADEVHIITSSNLGGIPSKLELFFKYVLRNDYAYKVVSNKIKTKLSKTDLYVYIEHEYKYFKFNALWFRFRFVISKLFNNIKIEQNMFSVFNKVDKQTFVNKFNNKLNKWLF